MTRTRRVLLSLLLASSAAVCLHPSGASAEVPAATETYTVRSGDSLVGIARRFGIRLSVLLDTNDLTISSVIHPGDSLTVPAASAATTPVTTGQTSSGTAAGTAATTVPTTSYTVQRGDALSTIAARHGVTLRALLTANKLEVTSTILPGRVLQIPPPTKAIPAVAGAATSATTGNSAGVAAPPATTTPTDVLVDFLKAQVGKPYKFFTAGPDTFDCSGLVVAGYRQIGIELPHQSGALAERGRAVDWTTEPIAAGDLIVLSSSTDPTAIGHVGVALSATSWIQAVGPGVPVQIRALPATSRFVTVRRVIGQ